MSKAQKITVLVPNRFVSPTVYECIHLHESKTLKVCDNYDKASKTVSVLSLFEDNVIINR